jgi:hypothetical protein
MFTLMINQWGEITYVSGNADMTMLQYFGAVWAATNLTRKGVETIQDASSLVLSTFECGMGPLH